TSATNQAPITSSEPAEPKLLQQVGCEFVPYVVGLRAGQTLLVRNSDPVLHNVHAIPAVGTNKESNNAQPAGAADLRLMFSEPELFLRIRCDLHPWMLAYVCVWPHGAFAVTDLNGSFEIANVPAGEYTLIAAHRKLH